MKFFLILCIFASVVISGCGTVEPDMPMDVKDNKPAPEVAESLHRFKVTRVGVFSDSLAYNSKRAVYVIKDTHTGKEYVGVSGIGISELGDHALGEETVRDER